MGLRNERGQAVTALSPSLPPAKSCLWQRSAPGWVSLGPGLGTPSNTAVVFSPPSLLGLPLLAELIGVSSVASGF